MDLIYKLAKSQMFICFFVEDILDLKKIFKNLFSNFPDRSLYFVIFDYYNIYIIGKVSLLAN